MYTLFLVVGFDPIWMSRFIMKYVAAFMTFILLVFVVRFYKWRQANDLKYGLFACHMRLIVIGIKEIVILVTYFQNKQKLATFSENELTAVKRDLNLATTDISRIILSDIIKFILLSTTIFLCSLKIKNHQRRKIFMISQVVFAGAMISVHLILLILVDFSDLWSLIFDFITYFVTVILLAITFVKFAKLQLKLQMYQVVENKKFRSMINSSINAKIVTHSGGITFAN
jgi:hypothetical protein